MPQAYRRTNLAVCRAGAATCAELPQFAVPALLVPYPYAVNGHQAANAAAMHQYGMPQTCCWEAGATSAALADYISRAMDSRRASSSGMRAAAAARSPDAAEGVADLVMDVARRRAVEKAGSEGSVRWADPRSSNGPRKSSARREGRAGAPAGATPRGHVHCLGICGVGMAGLAFQLWRDGWRVSGCDAVRGGRLSDWLAAQGVQVFAGHPPRIWPALIG